MASPGRANDETVSIDPAARVKAGVPRYSTRQEARLLRKLQFQIKHQPGSRPTLRLRQGRTHLGTRPHRRDPRNSVLGP